MGCREAAFFIPCAFPMFSVAMRSLLALLLLSCVTGLSQEIVHFNVTQQEGLPSNTVYNILQSRDGFLWIATENGLARYNGHSFRSYENQLIRSKAFSGLFEDNKGRIWLHNFFGEILYVENDTLKKLDSWENHYESGFPTITHFNDTLLVSTVKHAFLYSIQSKTWTNIDSRFSGSPADVLSFGDHRKDRDGNVWICYRNKTGCYLKKLKDPTKGFFISEDENGFNTLGSRVIPWQNTILLFDPQSHVLRELKNNAVIINNQWKDGLKNVRQASSIGDSLLVFTSPEGILFAENLKLKELLPGKNVSGVALDQEGGYWIGTLNEGVFYIPQLNSTLLSKEQWGLFTKIAKDERSNRLLVGSYDGSVTVFTEQGELLHRIKPIRNKEVQSLFVDILNNRLLVFTDRLYVYSLNNWSLINELAVFPVKEIIHVKNQYIMATSGGLVLMDVDGKNIKTFLSGQRIATVGHDEKTGLLWVGTQKGLYTHNLASEESTLWKTDDGNSPGVSCILTNDEQVILGTFTSGIYFLRNGKVEKRITVREGLLSNRISSLVFHKGVIWGGTEKGIFSIEPSTRAISVFDHSKGLAALEIYDLTFLANQLWVSHPGGLQRFTSLPSKNMKACIVHVDHISSDGNALQLSSEGITLQPSSKQLAFRFDVSNNLRSRGNTRIRYRMKEIDRDNWQETSLMSPIANYLALPSGNFTFEVMAINEDNVPSGNVISIPIHVLAPFWKRPWFLALVLLLAIVMAALISYWRFKRLIAQNQLKLMQQNQEQQLRIAQLTSIRAQMNPHFIFNTMSLIQGKVLQGLQDEANRHIQNFSTLLRKVLDFSGRELITLQEEVEVLEQYLAIEKARFDGSMEYSILLNDEAKREMIRIPSLLTQPFVENALRHGLMHKEGKKKIEISFNLVDLLLTVIVDDNGIGRKASAEINKARANEHTSFALDAYQKRIDLLNSSRQQKIKLDIIDKQNEFGMSMGTTVQITIPMNDGYTE
jgi:ligand-binding sensor domain-containing protein